MYFKKRKQTNQIFKKKTDKEESKIGRNGKEAERE